MVGEFVNNDWGQHLAGEFTQPYWLKLQQFLTNETTTLPTKSDWFKALNLCSLEQTKVVILGQDPYPNPSYAHGLCFSVPENIKPPASLKNIFKAIKNDLNISPTNPNLSRWANQGILLLNTILTVQQNKTNAHKNQGWEQFTDQIIRLISTEKTGVVFLLWGKEAQRKTPLIDAKKHLILTSSHPSPLSAYRGFLSCKHFSQTNTYLSSQNKKPIDWL